MQIICVEVFLDANKLMILLYLKVYCEKIDTNKICQNLLTQIIDLYKHFVVAQINKIICLFCHVFY